MDISTITTKPVRLVVRHPATDEPTGLVLTLVSLTSPALLEKRFAIEEETRTRIRNTNQPLTAAQLESQLIELRATAITGFEWNDGATWHGKTPGRSDDIAREMLTLPWLAAQVDATLNDTARFYE